EPEPGAWKVTIAPETGLPPRSVTNACKAVANGVEITALWGVPELAVMVAGGTAVFVSAKLADVAPGAEAATVKLPAILFAVRAGAAATPSGPVVAVAILLPVLGNVPPAPAAGAVNVTVTPAMGLLLASLTNALSPVANGLKVPVLCGVPAV